MDGDNFTQPKSKQMNQKSENQLFILK